MLVKVLYVVYTAYVDCRKHIQHRHPLWAEVGLRNWLTGHVASLRLQASMPEEDRL